MCVLIYMYSLLLCKIGRYWKQFFHDFLKLHFLYFVSVNSTPLFFIQVLQTVNGKISLSFDFWGLYGYIWQNQCNLSFTIYLLISIIPCCRDKRFCRNYPQPSLSFRSFKILSHFYFPFHCNNSRLFPAFTKV